MSSGPQGGVSDRHPVSRDQRMRVFVALFDYDPANMSPNVESHHDELAFREGQLIKVCRVDRLSGWTGTMHCYGLGLLSYIADFVDVKVWK